MKPCRIQMWHALKTNSKVQRATFAETLQENMEDERFASRRYNTHIWGTEKPVAVIEHECDSPKVNVLCTVSSVKVYLTIFFFIEDTITGKVYLDMMMQWLLPQLDEDSGYYIQQ